MDAHRIVGTEAALTLPRLEVWRHYGPRDWTTRMTMTRAPAVRDSPDVRQIEHFRAVVQESVPTHVGAIEGARNMAVLEAVQRSAATGHAATVARVGE